MRAVFLNHYLNQNDENQEEEKKQQDMVFVEPRKQNLSYLEPDS